MATPVSRALILAVWLILPAAAGGQSLNVDVADGFETGDTSRWGS